MDFIDELRILINKHSRENDSNTPDYILAEFMAKCLVAGEVMIQQRETWYGRDARPTEKMLLKSPTPEGREELK